MGDDHATSHHNNAASRLDHKGFLASRRATHGAAASRVIMLAVFDIVAAANTLQFSPARQGRVAASSIAPIALFFQIAVQWPAFRFPPHFMGRGTA
jgi:hypothetical protein